MARNFRELQAKMSPESQARARARADETIRNMRVKFTVAGEADGFPIEEEFTDAAEAEQRWRDLNSIEGSHVSVVETVVSEAK